MLASCFIVLLFVAMVTTGVCRHRFVYFDLYKAISVARLKTDILTPISSYPRRHI